MESKPEPEFRKEKEEVKEEKTFIQKLIQDVHLSEQGGLLTLLAFEKQWNPNG